MQTEIETRFLEINKEELAKKLVSLGATDEGEEMLEEEIFHMNDSVAAVKNRFVRLRKTKGKVRLTYKERTATAVDGAQEVEFDVSDIAKCSELFGKIGLTAVRHVEKYRRTLKLGDVTLDIDTWPKIPAYVEVEGPSVESLKDACNKLELDWEKRFDGDAREVFRHYGHDMDKLTVVTFSEFK